MSEPDLIEIIRDAMSSMKAMDVKVLDVREQTSITDTMVIASGNSNRQVKSISQKVIDDCKQHGFEIMGVEGQEQANWVLIDVGDAIVHVMHPDSRHYYQLEKLWSVDSDSEHSLP